MPAPSPSQYLLDPQAAPCRGDGLSDPAAYVAWGVPVRGGCCDESGGPVGAEVRAESVATGAVIQGVVMKRAPYGVRVGGWDKYHRLTVKARTTWRGSTATEHQTRLTRAIQRPPRAQWSAAAQEFKAVQVEGVRGIERDSSSRLGSGRTGRR